jgi:hypothetical protein
MTKHKLVRAITAAELETLLDDLAAMTDVTGQKIRDLAESRYGVEMGHDAANNFRKDVFGAYLERLRARKERVKMIIENRDVATGQTLADAASEELQQQVFDFLAEAQPLDLAKPEDMERAEALARIIKSARSEDRKMILDLREQLAAAEAREKLTAKAVMSAAAEKGASPELVGAIREAMNFRPAADVKGGAAS